ncbi:MAG: hypothetical protein V1793_10175 [Pseudomonadota bacterium]
MGRISLHGLIFLDLDEFLVLVEFNGFGYILGFGFIVDFNDILDQVIGCFISKVLNRFLNKVSSYMLGFKERCTSSLIGS